MNRCKVWLVGHASPLIVNAAAKTVAEQLAEARGPVVPMITSEAPNELHQGDELTIYVAPDYVALIEPLEPV